MVRAKFYCQGKEALKDSRRELLGIIKQEKGLFS